MGVTLFEFKSDQISIRIQASFEQGNLVIDGYDFGKTVEEVWGDFDYEYVVTVKNTDLAPLFGKLGIGAHDPDIILQEFAKKFNGNGCFTEFKEFLTENKIPFELFTWT